jgi:hypothetical protein
MHFIVVLRVPSTIHDTSLEGTDVTWLTAHSKLFTMRPQHILKEAHMQLTARISIIGHHIQGQTLITLVS